MHRTAWAVSVLVAILVVPAAASVTIVLAPVATPSNALYLSGAGPISHNTVTSLNWAGYAVTGPTGSVAFVQGSWVQPKVNCTSTATYSSFWVGIDGYTSNTVEQTGTEADCVGGVATYSAWYEFYPAFPVTFGAITVHPGDVFEGSVTYASGKFTALLKDVTHSTSGSHAKVVASAKRTSAEWIAEAPYSGGVLPLAKFGKMGFGKDATKISATNEARISGATHAIGAFAASAVHRINMTNGGAITKAATSALTPDGTSFNVTWKHS